MRNFYKIKTHTVLPFLPKALLTNFVIVSQALLFVIVKEQEQMLLAPEFCNTDSCLKTTSHRLIYSSTLNG
jgi:hypothetical protein